MQVKTHNEMYTELPILNDIISRSNLCPSCLNTLPRYLSPVETNQSGLLVGCLLDLGITGNEDNFDVARVSLVRVNTTVGTVRATTGFL